MVAKQLPVVKKKPLKWRSASLDLPLVKQEVLCRTSSDASHPGSSLPVVSETGIEPGTPDDVFVSEKPSISEQEEATAENDLLLHKFLVKQRKADDMTELQVVTSLKPVAKNKDSLIVNLAPILALRGIKMKDKPSTTKRGTFKKQQSNEVYDLTLEMNEHDKKAELKLAQAAAEKKELLKTIQQCQAKYKKLKTSYQEMDTCYSKSIANLQDYKEKYNELVAQVEDYILTEEVEKEKLLERERQIEHEKEKEKEKELEKEQAAQKLQRRNTTKPERTNSSEKKQRKIDSGDKLVNDTIHRFDYVVKSATANTIAAKERKKACDELKRNLYECTIALKALK